MNGAITIDKMPNGLKANNGDQLDAIAEPNKCSTLRYLVSPWYNGIRNFQSPMFSPLALLENSGLYTASSQSNQQNVKWCTSEAMFVHPCFNTFPGSHPVALQEECPYAICNVEVMNRSIRFKYSKLKGHISGGGKQKSPTLSAEKHDSIPSLHQPRFASPERKTRSSFTNIRQTRLIIIRCRN